MNEMQKFLRRQEQNQLDRYLGEGRHPNGGRNRAERHGPAKHASRVKSAKRTRCTAKRRSHK